MPQAATHTHTYIKWYPNRYKNPHLYKCNDPHCSHWDEVSMIVGKASLCTACGDEFVLTREDLRYVRPKCLNCANTKRGRQYRAARQLVDGLIDPSQESLI